MLITITASPSKNHRHHDQHDQYKRCIGSLVLLFVTVGLFLSGCATVVHGPTQEIRLFPKETSITLSSEDQEQLRRGSTSYPKDASLTYRDGHSIVWIPRNIRGDLLIECEGAQKGTPVAYKKKLSILFILGNVIYGPVGYLVDYKVGSAWHIELHRYSNFCEISKQSVKKAQKKTRKKTGKKKRSKPGGSDKGNSRK